MGFGRLLELARSIQWKKREGPERELGGPHILTKFIPNDEGRGEGRRENWAEVSFSY